MSEEAAVAERNRLDRLLEQGESYEFLNGALPRLDVEGRDHHLRLMAAREYVRLGLFGPARELLQSADEGVRGHTEMAALLDNLRGRGDVVAWCERRERFESNLAVLEERDLDVSGLERAWSECHERMELFTDCRGADQVRIRGENGRASWWPYLADHSAQAESSALPADHGQLMPGPYLVHGVGTGWYVSRVWRATKDTFIGYSSALYVAEPDPERLALVLHLHDWRELLADDRVLLFVGKAWTTQFGQRLLTDPRLPTPTHLVCPAPTSHEPMQIARDALEGVIDRRGQAVQAGHAELERRYLRRDAAHWAKRFDEAMSGRGPALRILGTVSTHTSFLKYSMRDIDRAARRLGFEFELIQETRPFEAISPQCFHQAIRRFDPDLFFVIDHLRSGLAAGLPSNLPVMTWDQDALQHVFKRENVARMSELDVVVGMPHTDCIARFGRDPRQFLASPMAASPEEFDGSCLSESELSPYRCDVSYVSHGAQTGEQFFESELAGIEDGNARRLFGLLLPLAKEAVRRFGAADGGILRQILRTAEDRSGVRVNEPTTRDRIIGWHLWRLCDRLYRHQALEWVGEWALRTGREFRIYGNGWQEHPKLARFAVGPVENGRDLLRVYRASTINLQLMPAGFIHQRALDGLLAGGFFLTRRTAGDRCDADVRIIGQWSLANGVHSAAGLRARADSAVIEALDRLCERYGHGREDSEYAFHAARFDAQLAYAAEVFSDFGEIVFDDPAAFAAMAEAFLREEKRRHEISRAMRQIVLERFSHQATLQRFMRFVAEYFASIASARKQVVGQTGLRRVSPVPVGA